MGLVDVKKFMSEYQKSLKQVGAIASNVVRSMGGLSNANALAIVSPCENLLFAIEKNDFVLNILHRMCTEELHIFFKEYNIELGDFMLANSDVSDVLNDVIELAGEIQKEFVLYIASMGADEMETDVSDIDSYSFDIEEYINYVYDMMEITIINDNKLIIPTGN